MTGLPFLVTALLATFVGGGDGASIHKMTVTSATCQGPSDPFQNPDSCRSFLQCDASGTAVVIPCPGTLEFNPKLKVCDLPERAGCSSAPPPPDSGSETGDGSDDGGDPPSPPADAPTCPSIENPEDVVQLPNPKDCGSFYKCDENGVAWLIKCPAGLQYNAKLRVCDYPDNAGCSTSSSPSNPSDDPPSDGGNDNGDNDGGNDDSPKPPPADAPTCPAIENPEDVVQLPNPKDCGSFYKCDENGVAWLNKCPAGLQYNAKLRVCDYPDNAGCSTSSSPSNPSDDPPSDGGNDNGDNDGGNEDSPKPPPADAPTCPATENQEDVVQLPNPKDCGSFYKCDQSGVAWLNKCPAGLHYNAKLRVCDYPNDAGCSI